MANSWQRSIQSGLDYPAHHEGHTTSVELAKQQKYITTSVLSHKRVCEDVLKPEALGEAKSIGFEHDGRPRPAVPPNKYNASRITHLDVHSSEEDSVIPQSTIRGPTAGPSQNPKLSLSYHRYGLPSDLVANFALLGIHSIYPWQASCLLNRELLEGTRNLIYTAPTGGGKSLVADVLMLKRIIENPSKKALLVLPYVALVQEKAKWLRHVADGVLKKPETNQSLHHQTFAWTKSHREIRVASFFGGSKSPMAWTDCDIAVCTIEKANMLLNSAIQDGRMNELGIVVVDELHMLDDEHRGYIMELLITKLVFIHREIQIIGMSATLSNPKLLADWFNAKFYVSEYRPIPLEEHMVYNNLIYPIVDFDQFFQTASQLMSHGSTQKPSNPCRQIAESVHKELSNPLLNAVVALSVETAVAGYGVLVFCSSRQGAQTVASLISDTLPHDAVSTEIMHRRADVLASLQALAGGCESLFSKIIPTGVAFHHAGLTAEEREIVAEAYDAGILKVMVATCSLAAGINLPARRVIIYGAKMGRDLVGPAMLRQMRGRAGRKGKDEIGETFLCCQKEELEAVSELLEAELPAVVSCLTPEKRGLKRALLEVIAIRLASSYESLKDYVKRSLLWHTLEHHVVLQMLDSALASLASDRLVEPITDTAYCPTRLGSAVVASGFTPEDGVFIYNDLRKALSSFVMNTELHIFYLFTPIPQISSTQPITADISWPIFRDLLDALDEPSLNALHVIGISPALVNSMAQSGRSDLKETTAAEINKARIYRRTYSAFALRDLCNEIPIYAISLKYNIPRGQIQNLARTCHGFAAGIIRFCQRMATPYNASTDLVAATNDNIATTTMDDPSTTVGFSMLSAVLAHMQDRLQAGARSDLLEMTQVTFVKGRMARLLHENGFKGVRQLAEADPKKDILPLMMQVVVWKLRSTITTTGGGGGGGNNGNGVTTAAETETEYAERKRRLEAKVLAKCEVMVRSAGRIWEGMCLRYAVDEE